MYNKKSREKYEKLPENGEFRVKMEREEDGDNSEVSHTET